MKKFDRFFSTIRSVEAGIRFGSDSFGFRFESVLVPYIEAGTLTQTKSFLVYVTFCLTSLVCPLKLGK